MTQTTLTDRTKRLAETYNSEVRVEARGSALGDDFNFVFDLPSFSVEYKIYRDNACQLSEGEYRPYTDECITMKQKSTEIRLKYKQKRIESVTINGTWYYCHDKNEDAEKAIAIAKEAYKKYMNIYTKKFLK